MAEQIRTALITGASSGIGRELAIWFARRGITVYAAARRTPLLEELVRGGHGKIVPLKLDVSKEAATVRAIVALDDECQGLDLVVANAGVGDATPAQTSSWEMVERVLRVNVMGAAATLTALLPRMVERNRGWLAGTSSLIAWRGLGAYSSYSASKAFLSTFLESLRVDLQGTNVHVTCVEPGFVMTEMNEKLAEVAPMPFKLNPDRAAQKIGTAILGGKRVLSFPWPTALGYRAITMIPASIFEPLAKRASRSQVAFHEALRAKQTK